MRNMKKNTSKIKFYIVNSKSKIEEFDYNDILIIQFENEEDKALFKKKIQNQNRILILFKSGDFKIFEPKTVNFIDYTEINDNKKDVKKIFDEISLNNNHVYAKVLVNRTSSSTINPEELQELIKKFKN